MAVCSRRERGTRVAQVFVNCRFLKRMGAPRPLRGLGHANPTPSLMPHEDRVPKSCPALICRDASCRHLVSGVLAKLRKSHNMQVPAVWLQVRMGWLETPQGDPDGAEWAHSEHGRWLMSCRGASSG